MPRFQQRLHAYLAQRIWSLTITRSSNVVARQAARTCQVISNLEADAP
jgi:hypothetical protein